MRRTAWRLLAVVVAVLGGAGTAGPTGAQVPVRPEQAPPSSTPAGGRPMDGPEVLAAARDGFVVAAELAAALDELGALSEPLPEELVPVIDAVEWPAQEPDELLDELVVLEADGESVLIELVGAVEPIDPAVSLVLGGLDDATWARIEAGEEGVVDPAPYLVAIDSLATRGGRPALDPATPAPDGDLLAARLEQAYDPPSVPATPTTPTPQTPSTTLAPGAAAGTDDRTVPWLLLAVAAVALAAIVAVVVVARRRDGESGSGPGSERFGDLLDVTRRLAAAGDAGEVERIAAAEAARLVDGAAAAVVHRDGAGLRVGHETEPGLLVDDRLADGVLLRAVETGQPVAAVVRDEPAVRQLPVALTAVPVISQGVVQALLVVVRAPERPFGSAEVDTVRSLGPVLAAALDSARRVADASHASLTDPLTGVGNRRRLEDELPALVASGHPTAVVMVDLDHFKAVNDRWGHPAGDAVLRQAAAVLTDALRPQDSVYRYGGEEFALVLPATSERDAVAAAERVRDAMAAAELDVGDGTTHRVTASLGVAATDGTIANDPLGLIAQADRALYRAKQDGRDRVVAAGSLAG